MTSFRWNPIEDLPENWEQMRSEELASLASTWRERSQELAGSDSLRQFNERLHREWAIETGIIENLYSIDRGTTQLLIQQGIHAALIPQGTTGRPVKSVVLILKDQEEVLEGVFEFVKQKRQLSTSYIKQLHQSLTRHQETVEAIDGLGRVIEVPLLRGDWKRQPNSPTRPNGGLHEYCPPEHVASEMDRLVALHLDHADKKVPPQIESAWLHHRFTQIHPFQDGNGRVARALASLILIRDGWFPLVIHRDLFNQYIDALEHADMGNLNELIGLFSDAQKKAFNSALSLSESVLSEPFPLQRILQSAGDRLKERRSQAATKMRTAVFNLSERLKEITYQKFLNLANELETSQLKPADTTYLATAECNDEQNDFWFKHQIGLVAKELGYYADTQTYRGWVRLRIIEERHTEIVVSFHALGVKFLGLMAATAFLEHRDRGQDGEIAIDGPHKLSKEIFQYSHKENEDSVVSRFEHFLDEVLLMGLEQWRRQL
jgi:Fic family protein